MSSMMQSDMYVVSIPDAQQLIRSVCVKHNKALMLWGPPGVGKSAMVAQVVKEHNGVLVDFRCGQYDSVDLRGFPGIDAATNHTVWYAPSTLPFKGNPKFDEQGPPIFVFADEINAAVPAVAGVLYQLFLDRCIGEHVLMDNVIMLAAGNRESDKGVTNRMPTPLANRFTHVEVGTDVNAWCQWAQDAGLPPIGIAFMQFRKELLNTFDSAKTAKAFATPRSWATALGYYADDTMPESIKMAALAGTVGQGPAAEFWGFVDVYAKIIPIGKILADPMGIALPEELSLQWATAINVSGAMDVTNVKALHAFITRMPPEIVLCAWTLATRRDKALYTTPEFMAFSKKYKFIFTP